MSRENQNYQRVLSQLNHLLIESAPAPVTIEKLPSLGVLFTIPFSLPNLQRDSGFVGREYPLERLRKGIAEGKNTLSIIVLYGTGGMGWELLTLGRLLGTRFQEILFSSTTIQGTESHGTVIITSRRPECIKQGRRGFEVYQMQPNEGIKVLMGSAVRKYEDTTLDGK